MVATRRPLLVVALLLVACTRDTTGDDEIGETGTETDTDTDTATDTSETDTGEPSCGDGIVQGDEACDDGNQNDADSCLNDCTLPACGDGIVQGAEGCDDGNDINEDACTNLCQANVCGDGFAWPESEGCDDGNQTDADGCEADCSLPACSNGIVDPGEICYASAVALEVSASPVDVAMADLDGDGNSDLVAGIEDFAAPLVSWLGDGAGGLSAAIPSAGQGQTRGVGLDLADLDGDQVVDAIHGGAAAIFVAWGQGDGGFESPSTIACSGLNSVTIGRFDDDALPDVACAMSEGGLPPTADVLFALNLGNRSFSGTTSLAYDVTYYPELAAADMDDDGDDELLVYDDFGSVKLWRQTAPATFVLESYGAPMISGWGIGVGDLDGDERPDVVLSLPEGMLDPTRILPLLQTPGEMLVTQPSVAAGMQPFGLTIADVSSDGLRDVVVVLRSGSVAILAGDGAGGLAPPVSLASGSEPLQVTTGDLDGDGVPELAVANYGGTTVSLFWSDP